MLLRRNVFVMRPLRIFSPLAHGERVALQDPLAVAPQQITALVELVDEVAEVVTWIGQATALKGLLQLLEGEDAARVRLVDQRGHPHA